MNDADTTIGRGHRQPRYPLNLDGPEYVWRQLADHLAGRIEAAEFGHRLPNRERLANEYGVSLDSVRRAVNHLAERGLVETLAPKGTYLT